MSSLREFVRLQECTCAEGIKPSSRLSRSDAEGAEGQVDRTERAFDPEIHQVCQSRVAVVHDSGDQSASEN
jgi:hypothetical protein